MNAPKRKIKPINTAELETIEFQKDGKSADRFQSLLRTVLDVPKEEILRREAAEKEKKKGG